MLALNFLMGSNTSPLQVTRVQPWPQTYLWCKAGWEYDRNDRGLKVGTMLVFSS